MFNQRPASSPKAISGEVSTRLTVRDVMTPHVRTIGRRHSLHAAADAMRDRHIQHLIVVDAAGRVCGVLSDRDLRAASPSTFDEDGRAHDRLGLLRVEELMAIHPVTVHPSDDVAIALRKMVEHKIGCVAVVDELGTAVGIVTGYDVVALALDLLDARR
jgi:acetoin utilization protein AcuB